MALWRAVIKASEALNALHAGDLRSAHSRCENSAPPSLTAAWAQTHAHLLAECQRFAKARRELCVPTGAQAAALLSKTTARDQYSLTPVPNHAQVAFKADLLDEPQEDLVVDMLSALPPLEAAYYAREENLVSETACMATSIQEIEQQYAFVGGSEREYVKYFHRSDLPAKMWTWQSASSVRTVCGFSAVAKKDGVRQRKLLMACSQNFCFYPACDRADHGLKGGEAISRFLVEGDLEIATLDENNAFSRVLVPEWMWPWQVCPPVRAFLVWLLLPEALRLIIAPLDWVFPCYCRLAMGSSQSVHILMAINMRAIGSALCSGVAMNGARTSSETEEDDTVTLVLSAGPRKAEPGGWLSLAEGASAEQPCTPEQFARACKQASSASTRVMVVLHLFSGPRRDFDVSHHLHLQAKRFGFRLIMVSADLENGDDWDMTSPSLAHLLNQLAGEGEIDIVGGGPPCNTFSAVRFEPGGPRPLRHRGFYEWGLPGLTEREKAKVGIGNVCLLNFLSVLDRVVACGGGAFFEHPADIRKCDPYPSVWAMEVVLATLERGALELIEFDQCMTGCLARKPTGLALNLDGRETFRDKICDGRHEHVSLRGKRADGKFVTTSFARYPPRLCELLAHCCAATLKRFALQGSGPRGSGSPAVKRVSGFSRDATEIPEGRAAIAIMNEECLRHRNVALSDSQGAAYLHVDDGVFLSQSVPSAAPEPALAHRAMECSARALQDLGFGPIEMKRGEEVDKVVGYEVVRNPPRLQMPMVKGLLLEAAFLWMAASEMVEVDLLHSYLSMWVWFSLLRREFLAIPQALFKFVEKNAGKTVYWWASARRELMVLTRLLPLVYAELSAPLCPVLFATDAMGVNEHDNGGWGLMALRPAPALLRRLFCAGARPGMTVCRLDGDIRGTKDPERALRAGTPFSRVPPTLVAPDTAWTELARGRWKHPDHITLGEGRAVILLLNALAATPSAHKTRIMSLMDNFPWGAAMAKGRSPSRPLNFLLRKRAALSLASQTYASLPWIDSERQPADRASRLFLADPDGGSFDLEA